MTWPRHASYALIALLALITALTFADYGISWDEWVQNVYGEKLLTYYTSGFTDLSAFEFSNLFLYGGFFDLIAAILNLVSPFAAYDTRHLLGGVIFVIGLVGGWKLTRLLAGERAALIAVVFLATTPLLYGHGFINPKDSPLAWFGIWTAYFCCRILDSEKITWPTVAGFGISLGLVLGTRVIGVVYIYYLIFVLAAGAAARLFAGRPLLEAWLRAKAAALPLAVGFAIAVVLMGVFWPWSVQKPGNFFGALGAFEHFPFAPLVLWEGQLIRGNELPQSYLPGLLILQLPEYVLLGLIPAALAGLMAWRRQILTAFAAPRAQQYLYLTCAALGPLAADFVMDPTLYNGMRHFLFVVPPLAIAAAIGWDHVIGFALRQKPIAGAVVAGLLALACGRQAVMLAQLHPYEYLSYNSIKGGIKGAVNRFELDYWGTTLRESARGLGEYLKSEPVSGVPLVFGCGDRTSTLTFLPVGTELTEEIDKADFYLAMTGVKCLDPRRPGRVVHEVKRMGVTLGYTLDLRPDHQTP